MNGTPVTDFTTPPVANDQDFVEIEAPTDGGCHENQDQREVRQNA
ncbi:hypothetical protein QJQ08_00160 [Chlamydia suis]|nr:hypothetical protein [Chlamydia suis]MEB2694234.1 hypothetical protein [Chlamydia suis]